MTSPGKLQCPLGRRGQIVLYLILKLQLHGWTFPKRVPEPLLPGITGPAVNNQVNYVTYQTNSIQPNRQSISSDRAHHMCEEAIRGAESCCVSSSCFLVGPGPRWGSDVSSFPWWPPEVYSIGHLLSFFAVFFCHCRHC